MTRILNGKPYKTLIDSLKDIRVVRSLLAESLERCLEIIDYKMPGEFPSPTWEHPNYPREVVEEAIRGFKDNQEGIPWSTAHWWGYRGSNLFLTTFGEIIYEFKSMDNEYYGLDKAKEWLGKALAIEASAYDLAYQEPLIKDQLEWLHKRINNEREK